MKKLALLLICCLCLPVACYGWEGRVTKIIRGDEFEVIAPDGVIERVRLYGIDTPGEPQPYGKEIKEYVTRRVSGKAVEVTPLVRDHFNRIIAYVSVDSSSLIEELLRIGYAWWYRKYVPWETGLAKLEADARKARVGLWSDRAPIPPWEFQPLPPSETAAVKAFDSISARGTVREKIVNAVGPAKPVIGSAGSVMEGLRKKRSQEVTDWALPQVRDMEGLSRIINNYLEPKE